MQLDCEAVFGGKGVPPPLDYPSKYHVQCTTKTDLTTSKVTTKAWNFGMWHDFINGTSVTKTPLPEVIDFANVLEIPIDAGSRNDIRKVNK